MSFAGINQGAYVNNWAALATAQAAAGVQDSREKMRKNSAEAKRMSTGEIKNEHQNELNNIAMEEEIKVAVHKGAGLSK